MNTTQNAPPQPSLVTPPAASVLECPGSVLFRIKKVLVPVDFSACSEKALTYAVQFAKEFGATLDIVYVVPPFMPPHEVMMLPEYTRVQEDMVAKGETKLASLVLQKVPQGIPAETFVRSGRPATEITKAAADLKADLIIISTHGHSGWHRVLLGSTVENVIRHAPCPVLTVREKEREFLAA